MAIAAAGKASELEPDLARLTASILTKPTQASERVSVSGPLAVLLHKLNQVLWGRTVYFRPGVSARADPTNASNASPR